jgi:penicillin-binding protein 1A
LSLPVWINFMEYALKGVPVSEPPVPAGVVNLGGEWYYEEYARGSGVSSLDLDGKGEASGAAPPVQVLPPSEERRRILELFRN